LTPSADELIEACRRSAANGNPYANLTIFRLELAEDPDAEAERIVAEWQVLAEYIVNLMRDIKPMLTWFHDHMGPN